MTENSNVEIRNSKQCLKSKTQMTEPPASLHGCDLRKLEFCHLNLFRISRFEIWIFQPFILSHFQSA
ncbi:MAG: hypothetical protein AUH91_03995 [Verrucomicrobia bacterium 13_1_40CM_4_54_4]|nr:MAG: hypothetical protein AUH91_03995 [Verrucomicrobia bacterium 13_1_40CM_4_54_4]PYJ48610.1 MAG: hypothetical protein DME87_12005 [Verrucomicrobiota bacterium]